MTDSSLVTGMTVQVIDTDEPHNEWVSYTITQVKDNVVTLLSDSGAFTWAWADELAVGVSSERNFTTAINNTGQILEETMKSNWTRIDSIRTDSPGQTHLNFVKLS